ncbi:MAG: hypothetical protein KDD04_11495 [Sinomicrobium sp.]|nr:hypothetical protein [Sinomicrobium sp.]
MYQVEDYQPKEIVFTLENTNVPRSLGKFGSEEEAAAFMKENFLAMQTRYTASRYMDQVETEILRDEYRTELEEVLPELRAEHLTRMEELEMAKENEKIAKEAVFKSINKVQELADKVREGVTEMALDFVNTWKLIYNGKKYFYTYMNGELKLAGVQDVSAYEINELTGNSEKNKTFFEERELAVTDR